MSAAPRLALAAIAWTSPDRRYSRQNTSGYRRGTIHAFPYAVENSTEVLCPMRWLHLTDLHFGLHAESQQIAIRSAVAAIEREVGTARLDAVLVTGDLSNAGAKPQFDGVAEDLLLPLRSKDFAKAARFIVVPGNHDIDCDVALPIASWDTLDEGRRRIFFEHTEAGEKLREQRSVGFRAFSNFLQEYSLDGLDPLTSTSSLVSLAAGEWQVAFVCLNTAMFSDRAISDKGRCPAPVIPLTRELQRIPQGTRIFVLAHHPLDWFLHASTRQFRSALAEHKATYLHGHSHEPSTTNTQAGLESLGFGAGYQDALDSKPDPQYENTFALCEYDGDLHVALFAWDALNGRWVTKTQLPQDFSKKSSVLDHGYVFRLADIGPASQPAARTLPGAHEARAPQGAPTPNRLLLATTLDDEGWWSLLGHCGVARASMRRVRAHRAPGEVEFLVEDQGSSTVVRCISGHGHIVTAREVEAENTRLDTETHSAAVIVCLGDAEPEARQLVARLQLKKSIDLYTNADLALGISQRLRGAVAEHASAHRRPGTTLTFVVEPAGVGVLVVGHDDGTWFHVVDAEGQIMAESHPVVRQVRLVQSDLGAAVYLSPGESGAAPPSATPIAFSRTDYLSGCKQEFDSLRYAPLAALGFKLPSAKLLDVYEPAGAEVASSDTWSEALANAVDDLLDSFDLKESMRAQFRAQLLGRFSGGGGRDQGAAQAFYQQYRNILVLGEPGSGKTCFVKSEILSYCDQSSTPTSWHSRHTPVFVPLAEAAGLRQQNVELLAICAGIAQRRGLRLTLPQLEAELANGTLAFFFDGLDEVPSLELRSRLLGEIAALVDRAAPLGNRIVLTSRPAAVDALELPPSLTVLHMRGLSDDQIERLATRILAAELTRGGSSVRLLEDVSSSDRAVVDTLLSDIRNKPGIARLARNPLLLTLLVMVYANAGAPAAKRHRVYAQAVQTLVSVRTRNAGQVVLSESDLRRRLGTLALAIYYGQISVMPSRGDVVALLADLYRKDGRTTDAEHAATEFLRLVSENTGLLSIHTAEGDDAPVSFMHYSFLEYYAAVGLVASADPKTFARLVGQRRWREVVAISAGIIGDQADVSPLIDSLLDDRPVGDRMSEARLLYAFDCALECEVPPERVQRRLLEEVMDSLSNGAARVEPRVRGEFADRLARLAAAAGDQRVLEDIVARAVAVDAGTFAAILDVVARLCAHIQPSAAVVSTLEEQCETRRDAVVRVAVCDAAARTSLLHTPRIVALVRDCFSKSTRYRYAAARAVEAAPPLAGQVWSEIVECTNDLRIPIAAAAARALIEAGLDIPKTARTNPVLLERCLRRWQEFAQPKTASALRIEVAQEYVDQLLSSPTEQERVIGLRLLPWLPRNERYVHERLFDVIALEVSGAPLVAALESLRLTSGLSGLLRSQDLACIQAHVSDAARTRDVRVAAMRAASALPPDPGIVGALLGVCRTSFGVEFQAALRALAFCAPTDASVHQCVVDDARERLRDASRGEYGAKSRQVDFRRVLITLAELAPSVPQSVADSLARMASDYRAPTPLRLHARTAFGRVCPITPANVRRICDWLDERGPDAMFQQACVALRDFLIRAHRSTAFVVAIRAELDHIDGTVIKAWTRRIPRASGVSDDNAARSLARVALVIGEMRSTVAELEAT